MYKLFILVYVGVFGSPEMRTVFSEVKEYSSIEQCERKALEQQEGWFKLDARLQVKTTCYRK